MENEEVEEELTDQGIGGTGLTDDVFARRLPDDCVQYMITVIDETITTPTLLHERLREVQRAAKDLSKKYLKDYIWQRQDFQLKFRHDHDAQEATAQAATATSPLSWVLQGTTNFGDSIADEWLIVHLLREISLRFPSVWIRVYDTDGEFLLIEAAAALPKWLNPDVAENRVWLHQGHLKLVPLDETSPTLSTNLTLQQAVSCISANATSLVHEEAIEKEAFFRLRTYPDSIATNTHHALVRLPRRVAYVLHALPTSIAAAVEAFYLRDPIALKPLATKDVGTLVFPPEDFVTVSVKFNRTGYAQLRSQEFKPPPSWTAVTPHLGDEKVVGGMKVACGFEMLLRDPSNKDERVRRKIEILLQDLEEGEKLPTDEEMQAWGSRQDSEEWLNVGFEDLEEELKGSEGKKKNKGKFGDEEAQENLRRMVERFEGFMKDEKAGMDGVELGDEKSTGSSEVDSDEEDKDDSFDEAAFEQAMREMMGMPPEEKEKAGLVDEARKLAMEMEDEEEMQRDEDEEARKIMEMMEKELRGHRALDMKDLKTRAESKEQRWLMKGKGPERMQEVEELSSEDEMEKNDVDVELLRNVLESLKGQAGMSGPAGSMLAAMGIQVPRDDGADASKSKGKGRAS